MSFDASSGREEGEEEEEEVMGEMRWKRKRKRGGRKREDDGIIYLFPSNRTGESPAPHGEVPWTAFQPTSLGTRWHPRSYIQFSLRQQGALIPTTVLPVRQDWLMG
jgi:hypothetical protein